MASIETRDAAAVGSGRWWPRPLVAAATKARWRGEAPYVALLLAAYLLPLLLVSPFGSFALVDDWVYARSVRHLVEEGRLHIPNWTATTLVFQVVWGALFAKLFGFSFTVLRCSTLALNLAGGLALYALCRELGIGRPRALAGACVYWLNPLTFSLSYTFMSDVPAVSLMLLATLFFVRGVRRSSDLDFVLGSVFAALAFLVRHPGILLPPAVLAYGLLTRWPARLLVRRLFAIAAIPALVVAGYLAWTHSQGLPGEQARLIDIALVQGPALWRRALLLGGYLLLYLGLFSLPLALGLGADAVRAVARWRQVAHLAALVLGANLVVGLVLFFAWLGSVTPQYAPWMPYLTYGSMIQVAGIGPNNVRGQRSVLFTLPWQIVLTILSTGGLVFLGALLYHSVARARRGPLPRTAPAGVVAMIGLFQGAGIFPVSAHVLAVGSGWLSFDRYFLPLVPVAIVLALWAGRGLRLSPALVLPALLAIALFSLAGTQDWLSYNRVRWQLGRELMARGVPLRQIDAGMEWDGWRLYEETRGAQAAPRTPDAPIWVRDIAPSIDSTYVIAFSPLPGYEVRERREYPSWLHAEPVYLYLQERR